MKAFNKIYEANQYNNLRDIINTSAKLYPENNSFILKHKNGKEITYKNITYKDFKQDIDYLGTALMQGGLENKRFAIISKNRYEWILTYLAVMNGNGITVPLDKGLKEEEIISCLERSKADAIVFEKEYLDIIKKAKDNSNIKIKQYICMDNIQEDDTILLSNLLEKGKELLKSKNEDYLNVEIDNNKMSTIIFTSGTTSMSKAVMLSHYNIACNITDMQYVEKIYSTDVNMAFLPFHHTFGSTGILYFLSNGAANVFCDGLRHIQSNLVEYKVSVFVCVPLLLESMYKKIMATIEKQGKTKTVKFGLALSNFLLKFKIDIRKKLFKDVINNLGGNLRFIISRSICT